jgi:hypothetical protein
MLPPLWLGWRHDRTYGREQGSLVAIHGCNRFMALLRLFLALLVFVPACAVLGALANDALPWLGLVVGAGIGLLVGLIFGDVKGQWREFVYGPPSDPDILILAAGANKICDHPISDSALEVYARSTRSLCQVTRWGPTPKSSRKAAPMWARTASVCSLSGSPCGCHPS